MTRPGLRQQRQAERFAAYAALRDAGSRPVDAARETGLPPSTRDKYERAYREARGLAPRNTGRGWGP